MMSSLGWILENRIKNTLKINPNLTYMDALFLVLMTEGVLLTKPSLTSLVQEQRSEMVKQSDMLTD